MRITQAQFEARQLERLPGAVQALLRAGHRERIGARDERSTSPVFVANQWLAGRSRELLSAQVARAYDEQQIRDHAENYARLCSRMRSRESRASFCVSCGVKPPAGRNVSAAGACARMDDPLWWRRQLRKAWTRSSENGMRNLGLIRKGREPYTSEEGVRHRGAQRQRTREFLESAVLVERDSGEQLPLLPIVERSLANPAIRRGEFMTRVRGFEEIAKGLGHVAEFVTLTAPSVFHAQLSSGGENPRYGVGLPGAPHVREAQQWLCRMWGRARAKLRRLSVLVYGFRIAEPHHDATPHWHLLLFVRPAEAALLRTLLRAVWLSEYGTEPGAAAARVKAETIDPAKGSAAGYVAKYVSKNIDGAGAIGAAADDETGGQISDGIKRVDAWASIHGIRQFQQIGGPPVGLWREARRLRSAVADRDIERARERADSGDWAGFVDAVGGIACGRRTNLRLERCETGERNRYGEARPAAVIGLRYASAVSLTRLHRWRIERAGVHGCAVKSGERTCGMRRAAPALSSDSSLGPVAITVRGAAAHGAPAGWTNPNETSRAGPNE